MKNLLLILLCVMAFTSVKADNLPTLKIDTKKSFVLNTNDWNNTELTVTIIDRDGVLIHEDTILPTEKGSKKYNLQILPKGDYYVVVSDDFKTVKYQLSVTSKEVSSISSGNVTYYPQVNATQDNIDINLMALSKKVDIALLDEEGREIYMEKVKDMPTITRRLNIAKLERGDYTLRVNVGDSWYTQVIRK